MRSERRRFVRTAGCAGAAWLAGLSRFGGGSRTARAADSRIEVLLDEPLGRIAPEVHGHAIHLRTALR
jgi:hypothetical protein